MGPSQITIVTAHDYIKQLVDEDLRQNKSWLYIEIMRDWSDSENTSKVMSVGLLRKMCEKTSKLSADVINTIIKRSVVERALDDVMRFATSHGVSTLKAIVEDTKNKNGVYFLREAWKLKSEQEVIIHPTREFEDKKEAEEKELANYCNPLSVIDDECGYRCCLD